MRHSDQELLFTAMGLDDDNDLVLLQAVRRPSSQETKPADADDGKSNGTQPFTSRYVTFTAFQEKLRTPPLDALFRTFQENLEQPEAVHALTLAAKQCYGTLADGINDVYREWYGLTEGQENTASQDIDKVDQLRPTDRRLKVS